MYKICTKFVYRNHGINTREEKEKGKKKWSLKYAKGSAGKDGSGLGINIDQILDGSKDWREGGWITLRREEWSHVGTVAEKGGSFPSGGSCHIAAYAWNYMGELQNT